MKTYNNKDEPLTGNDIIRLMDDMNERANIMVDSDIKPTDNIEDIFKNKGHVLLFHKWQGQDIGHWVCMIRNKALNQVYYFDSFGKDPYNKAIVDVVLKKYPKLLINDVKFQPKNSNACGRFCLLIFALNKLNVPPIEIEKFLKSFDVDKFVIDTIQEDTK